MTVPTLADLGLAVVAVRRATQAKADIQRDVWGNKIGPDALREAVATVDATTAALSALVDTYMLLAPEARDAHPPPGPCLPADSSNPSAL